jgi:hypothetical protein
MNALYQFVMKWGPWIITLVTAIALVRSKLKKPTEDTKGLIQRIWRNRKSARQERKLDDIVDSQAACGTKLEEVMTKQDSMAVEQNKLLEFHRQNKDDHSKIWNRLDEMDKAREMARAAAKAESVWTLQDELDRNRNSKAIASGFFQVGEALKTKINGPVQEMYDEAVENISRITAMQNKHRDEVAERQLQGTSGIGEEGETK